MEEKELTMVNDEDIEETGDEIEEIPEKSGIGTGWAMLIGSGFTLAAIAAGKKAKKMWQAHKAKKELKEVDDIDETESEPTDESTAAEPTAETPKKSKK